MKIRTDFVTNSCGSFIVVREANLTEKQREASARFAEENDNFAGIDIPPDYQR